MDSAFALRLAKDLRDAGHPVWLDQLDIPAGTRWDVAVEAALQESDSVLVVLSPESVDSTNVMDEVSYAVEEGRRLIPILAAPCKIPFRLRRIQHIDFTGDYDAALQVALRDFTRRMSAPISSLTTEEVEEALAAPPAADAPEIVLKPEPVVEPEPVESEAVKAATDEPAADIPAAAEPAAVESAPAPKHDAPTVTPARPKPEPSRRAASGGGASWLKRLVVVAVLAIISITAYVNWDAWFGNEGGSNERFAEGDVPTPPPVVRPTARFSASVESGRAPLAVTFRNQSVGEITSVRWDFGDGTTSTEAAPTHTYAAGTYPVTLRVEGPGGSDARTLDSEINVTEAPAPPGVPRARFRASAETGYAPLDVTFTNTSTGEITGHQWTFGDGGTSSATSPTHRFTRPGAWDVTLRSSGPGGTGQYTVRVNVIERPPFAIRIGGNRSGAAPFTTQLEVGAMRGFTGAVTYAWDFGDGTRGTGSTVSKTYPRAGSYTVTVRGTHAGGTADASVQITVTGTTVASPVANFTVNAPGPFAPYDLRFTGTSTGQVTRYEWDFGDGTKSAEVSPVHRFPGPGSFTVVLHAIGPGGTNEKRSSFTFDPPGTIRIAASATSGTAPLQVRLQAQGATTTGEYHWYFPDGSRSNGVTVDKTFSTPGRYTVGLWRSVPGIASAQLEIVVNAASTFIDPRTMLDRYFKLRPRSRETECLEGYRESVGPAVVMQCGNMSGQLWRLRVASPTHFHLTTQWVERENLCLEGNGPGPQAVLGGASFMGRCGNFTGQFWQLTPLGGGYFRLQSAAGVQENKCLDANVSRPGAPFNGRLMMATCNGGASQQWKFTTP